MVARMAVSNCEGCLKLLPSGNERRKGQSLKRWIAYKVKHKPKPNNKEIKFVCRLHFLIKQRDD